MIKVFGYFMKRLHIYNTLIYNYIYNGLEYETI